MRQVRSTARGLTLRQRPGPQPGNRAALSVEPAADYRPTELAPCCACASVNPSNFNWLIRLARLKWLTRM